jgi:hypothetical protein
MPIGDPTLIRVSVKEFLEGGFFGYLWATVQTPSDLYVGLLPIKHQGHLICPGGTFSGFFFSEELRFALANGYKLLIIGEAFKFQRGEITFTDLIQRLNKMKVEAHLAKQPVRRNIAKLLMNSLYGRFGMHPNEANTLLVTSTQFNSISKHLTVVNSVTAYSRMIINQYKLDAIAAGHTLYYSDTDSLVLSGPLPVNLLDDAELGKLKLEHQILEGYFVASL